MRFVLIANSERAETQKAAGRVQELANRAGVSCRILENDSSTIPQDTDAIVVVGGDGTLIRAAHLACRYDIPMMGVHCGRVGFLTELNEETFPEAVARFRAGDYRESVRSMLDVSINGAEPVPCLNDVLVFKSSFSGVAQLDFSVDADRVGTLFGDGIVIATPTGATGYSLSAGGPILAPGLDAMLITPICPHTLHMRPIAASLDSTIRVSVSDNCFVASDGDEIAKLQKGDVISVTRSRYRTRILTFENRNPFRLIAEKLT